MTTYACVHFNPMYLSVKCDACKKHVGIICGNCPSHLCKSCHKKPTFFDRLKLGLIRFLAENPK